MIVRGARAALLGAAALLAWYALRRTAPHAGKPAELLDGARASSFWTRADTLDRGETLTGLLIRGGLSDSAARSAVSAAAGIQDPRRMPQGMPIQFQGDTVSETPNALMLKLAPDRLLHVTRDSAGAWTATEERLPWITDTVLVRGAVEKGGNLYEAIAGVPDSILPQGSKVDLINRVASVYEYKFDMTRALWAGDSIYAVAQRKRGPESLTRIDTVLAARLFSRGKMFEAYVFPDETRRPMYYDAGGKSLATRFLRMPIPFARISSGFNPSRFHPILRTWRAHKGTDYAAASGTPVRAIGDGRVLRAVYNPGGYGNMVDVDHGTIVTRYGHLRAFASGVRAGAFIRQGETVGYVGMTGLATAPHLHFEILKSGQQVNPERALQNAEGKPLNPRDEPAFSRVRSTLLTLFQQPDGVVHLASLGPVPAAKPNR